MSFVRAVPVILIFRISFLRGPFLSSSILSPSSEMPSLSHNRAHSDSCHLVITVAEDILQPTNSNGFHVCFFIAHDRDSREFLISRRQWLSRNLLTSPLGTGLSTILFQNIETVSSFLSTPGAIVQPLCPRFFASSISSSNDKREVLCFAWCNSDLHPMTMTVTLASASLFAYRPEPAVFGVPDRFLQSMVHVPEEFTTAVRVEHPDFFKSFLLSLIASLTTVFMHATNSLSCFS